MTGAPRSTDTEPAAAPAELEWAREWLYAGLVALWAVLVVLWTPIASLATHTLGPWDWLADSSTLTQLPPPSDVRTFAIEDPVRQMIPWAVFSAEQFARGEAPLWNHLNGTGIPVLANYQSAVFSPFVTPFYVLPLALATLASAAAKLATAAASTYFLLRLLRRSRWAAAFGAVGFALCGFHNMCLLHPHVGVFALLPAALCCVELAARAFERERARLPWCWLACLSLALGGLVLAGHPESLLFAVYGVAAYSLFRVGGLALAAAKDGAGLARAARFGVALAGFGALGAAVGAVQILPFVEYLLHSAALALGGRDVERLEPYQIVLQLFPNVASTPRDLPWIPHALRPRYQEVNSFHVGGLYVMLAASWTLFARRERSSWCFAALGGGVLLYAFDAPLLGALLRPLFGADLVPAPRASGLWVLSAAALAAAAADRLLELGSAAPRRLGALVLAGAGALIVGARAACPSIWADLAARAPESFAALAPALEAHVEHVTWTLALGLAAVGAHLILRSVASRNAAFALLMLSAAGSTLLSFRGYVPTSEDRYVTPRTPAIEGLRRDVGDARIAMLSPRALRSNANLFYGVDVVTSYDALEILELDELRTEVFGVGGYQAVSTFASRRGLELFGVEFVATRAEWLPLDTDRCRRGAPAGQRAWTLAAELGLGSGRAMTELTASEPRYTQTFVASRAALDGLVLHFVDDARSASAQVRVALRDAAGGGLVAERGAALGELRLLNGGRREFVLRFEGRADSAGRTFELEVCVDRLPSGATLRMFRGRGARADGTGPADEDEDELDEAEEARESQSGERAPRRGRAARAGEGRGLGARALLDVGYGLGDFELVGEHADFVLHRYRSSLGRAWIVGASEVEPDGERSLARVLDDDFDPRSTVLLSRGEPRAPAAPSSSELEELAREPRRSSWRYRSAAAGYLVVAQAYFPGWRATIDGREMDVLRANHAFVAVELPPGEGVVELRYAPASFRWGSTLSLASLLALVGVLVASRRSRSR